MFEGINQTHKEAFERGLAVQKSYQSSLEPKKVKLDLLKWEPPPINSYKLNVDATLFFNLAKVGYGAIVRDWKGETLLAITMADSQTAQPKTVEALAILCGLQLFMHQDFDPLTIESNYLLVVEDLTATAFSKFLWEYYLRY